MTNDRSIEKSLEMNAPLDRWNSRGLFRLQFTRSCTIIHAGLIKRYFSSQFAPRFARYNGGVRGVACHPAVEREALANAGVPGSTGAGKEKKRQKKGHYLSADRANRHANL